MPQVSDRFGPIQQQVTLNGSGNGTVSFQATGANVRITNLYVRVSTSTNQAIATVYKGFISDGNRISSTNSGSTGAACHGTIDLLDGETAIVQWTGGDAGAVATATFTGNKIPFEVIGSSELTWDDPIAAGDGSLIFPAIKSPNFVTGVSGWRISRDGSVEFGAAVIRGELKVVGATGNSYIWIRQDPITGQPEVEFRPQDTGFAGPDAVIQTGSVAAQRNGSTANNSTLSLTVAGPKFNASLNDRPLITLTSTSFDGTTTDHPVIDFNSNQASNGPLVFSLTNATTQYSEYGVDIGKGIIASNGRNTDTGVVSGATEGSIVSIPARLYYHGRAYGVKFAGLGQITAGAPTRLFSRLRKGSSAGQLLGANAHQFAGNGTEGCCDWYTEFYVDPSSSDISALLLWTFITGIVGVGGQILGSVNPAIIQVSDIGPSSRVSSYAPALV